MKAFDVDARSQEREQQTITIGGQEFHPARRTTKVNRELRKARRQVLSARTQIEALAAITDRELTDAELGQQDTLEEQIERATAEMVAVLMVDGDGKPPTARFLMDKADQTLLADLLASLLTDEDAAEDPADPQTASTSS